MARTVAEPPVFVQRSHRGEQLAAGRAFQLSPAVCVHPLVATEVGELGVRLETDFADEGLDAAVDVRVLLEPAGRGEGLITLRAGMRTGSRVLGAQVPLQVAGIGKSLVAVIAEKQLVVPEVGILVFHEFRFPSEG